MNEIEKRDSLFMKRGPIFFEEIERNNIIGLILLDYLTNTCDNKVIHCQILQSTDAITGKQFQFFMLNLDNALEHAINHPRKYPK
jgi:hypothetical protein